MAFFGRGKNKVQDVLGLKASYEHYTANINPASELSSVEYHKIIREFYEKISDHILYERGTFILPYGMGKLRVCKMPVSAHSLSTTSIDWQKTVEYGKHIHHLNDHTNGFKYTFWWNRDMCTLKNLKFYRLVMTRRNKRLLAKLIKHHNMDYYGK